MVVGGGVGGLATGLALQRLGWEVRVRERSTVLEPAGAGLVLWPNALRCLRVLGVEGEVRSRGTVLRESRITRPNGRRLSRVDLGAHGEDGALGMVRSDLVEVLAAALDPGVLELGSPVDGPEEIEADVVVGADGVRSVVRTALWPSVVPEHRGYTVWRALLGGDEPVLGEVAGLTETWGRGLRFGVVPVGTGGTYVYAAASSPQRRAGEDELAQLRRLFEDWHAPIPALLDRLQPAGLLRHDIHDLPPGRTPLHQGRHVLVGDAAHAMEPNLGQGACLAIEDAVVLAHSLAAQPSVSAGLSSYAAARASRVASLARQSRRLGRVAQQANPWATAVRDAAMLMTPDWSARLATRGAAGWQPPASAVPAGQPA